MNDTTPPLPTSSSSDDKLWIILSHLSLLLGVGFLLPLIVYLVKKQDAPLTAAHAKEALNFHISLVIYGIVSALLCFVLIGFVLLPVLGVAAVVLSIIASVKASDGQFFRYPLTLRLV